MKTIQLIQDWFVKNCDNDLKDIDRITIETLDNPGWFVRISLVGTNLEGLVMENQLFEVSDNDWYGFKVDDKIFIGIGDPGKLELILEKFRTLTEAAGNEN